MKNSEPQVERVEAALSELRRAMVGARERLGDGLQLTRTQLEILMLFIEQPVWTIGELAKRLLLTPSAVTQTVDTLVRRNLVARYADEHDRRIIRLELAPEGQRLTGQIRALKAGKMRALVSRLSESEIDAFITITQKFAALLRETK
jgi:DNA-binding MarR family transcriptional regulator